MPTDFNESDLDRKKFSLLSKIKMVEGIFTAVETHEKELAEDNKILLRREKGGPKPATFWRPPGLRDEDADKWEIVGAPAPELKQKKTKTGKGKKTESQAGPIDLSVSKEKGFKVQKPVPRFAQMPGLPLLIPLRKLKAEAEEMANRRAGLEAV